ncbi:LpqB family beta-propeller domain-containing protein [Nocardioides sp.]|uniref:LpqB family beta-propeller domain-containing protein n=1 Tax=Nocardioides sp. TaxID=35761 RepID=UPI00261B0CDA|nr:LpqB family beta-propeller domain-containing protein [Nocardioides sp.]
MNARSWRAVRAALALAAVAVLTSACLGVPTGGQVVSVGSGTTSSGATGIAIDPRPPRKGMGPNEIVDGFLEALLATPLQTSTAGQFLTADAQKGWKPDDQVLVYSGKASAVASGDDVSVQLGPTWRIDGRGVWQGAVATTERRLTFTMTKEDGQWRIAEVPNALIVPDWWFEGRYSQMSLYYFNASETQLVPEPVFVPRGNELATVLVRDLLLGPGKELEGLIHSVVPADVSQGLSVPIDANGVASIELSGNGDDQVRSADATNKLIAQLAWTLRQDSDISRMQLSIGGQPVSLSNGRTEFDVSSAGPQFDPAGYQSSPLLFGVKDRKVVAGTLPQLSSTRGPLGQSRHDLRSIGVDLSGTRIAAVTGSGQEVLLTATTKQDEPVTTVLRGGRDLLKPVWDGEGRLWLVDRRRTGARISVVADAQTRQVTLPGISGADVRRLLVSRDGTRVLAVVRNGMVDRVVVSRISTSSDGVIGAVGEARVVSSDLGEIDDMVWASPTSVTVLHRLDDSARVTTLPVDGAGVALMPGGTLVGQVLSGLIGSPASGQPTYGVDGRDLISLSTVGRDETIAPGVTALTYVG